jgi:hypothetical protein
MTIQHDHLKNLLKESQESRDIMGRSLVDHMKNLRHFQDLAINAMQERDDILMKLKCLEEVKRCALTASSEVEQRVKENTILGERLVVVEQQRDDAQLELKQLRASTKHLEARLVDGSDSSMTDDDDNQTKVWLVSCSKLV